MMASAPHTPTSRTIPAVLAPCPLAVPTLGLLAPTAAHAEETVKIGPEQERDSLPEVMGRCGALTGMLGALCLAAGQASAGTSASLTFADSSSASAATRVLCPQ
jgi:hypothetical protein